MVTKAKACQEGIVSACLTTAPLVEPAHGRGKSLDDGSQQLPPRGSSISSTPLGCRQAHQDNRYGEWRFRPGLQGKPGTMARRKRCVGLWHCRVETGGVQSCVSSCRCGF